MASKPAKPEIVWYAMPAAGDIVYCRFPQEIVGKPGPKPRPALVLKVGECDGGCEVLVAYGTSQKVRELVSGEFAIFAEDSPAFDKSGLSYPTKFSLRKTVTVPYNSLWFCPPPSPPGSQSPKLGELHATCSKKLQAAFSVLTKNEQERLATK
jgi:hypothetical protein